MLPFHRCHVLVVVALWVACSSGSHAEQEPVHKEYPHYFDFSLVEKAGVSRSNEPVRVGFQLPPGVADPGAVLLWNRSRAGQFPAQLEQDESPRRFRILLLASQAAGSKISYRLYYGGRMKPSETAQTLKVSGEPLEWKVENRCLVADFSRNPGTGRSGQLNKIFLKEPGVWLSRERDQSTLHLSPNAAGSEHYVPVNRWDPPEKWRVYQGTLSFRLEREGPMPRLPGLRARVVYEVFTDACIIAVEEQIQAVEDTALSLLRVGELTLAPDPRNPFTHLAWGSNASDFVVRPRQEVPPLPLETPWMAFINAQTSFAMASVLEKIQYLPVARPPTLRNPFSRFSGQPPHYFFRTFIVTETNDAQRLVDVASGTGYFIRHWIYCPTGRNESTEGLAQRISAFATGAQEPLQVQNP